MALTWLSLVSFSFSFLQKEKKKKSVSVIIITSQPSTLRIFFKLNKKKNKINELTTATTKRLTTTTTTELNGYFVRNVAIHIFTLLCPQKWNECVNWLNVFNVYVNSALVSVTIFARSRQRSKSKFKWHVVLSHSSCSFFFSFCSPITIDLITPAAETNVCALCMDLNN